MISIKNSAKPGFSFMELIVSLVIIGLIISFAGPPLLKMVTGGRKSKTHAALRVITQGIQQYKMNVGSYPASLQSLIEKPESVSALVWEGPYVAEVKGIPEIPKGGWDEEIIYKLNPRGTRGTIPPFDLYSNGDPDKEEERIEAR